MSNINDKGGKNSFEVMPLDINIAKLQFNLLKRCEYEIPENGIFTTIREAYNNKDKRVDISEIQVSCKYDTENKDTRHLVAEVSDAAGTKRHQKILCSGSKNDILTYLKSSEKDFFNSVKTLAQTCDNK